MHHHLVLQIRRSSVVEIKTNIHPEMCAYFLLQCALLLLIISYEHLLADRCHWRGS